MVEETVVNGVASYWFIPDNAIANRIIIYLHGGVYALGSVYSHGNLITHIAAKLKTRVLFVDYALAPEHPYPAASDEVMNVYTELMASYPDHQIGFIGDSAGGGLTVTAIGRMLKAGLPLPYAVAMISPWIDLAAGNASYQVNQNIDPVLNTDIIKNATQSYLNGTPIKEANPVNVALNSFPPVLIAVGTNEILLDDSINFYEMVKLLQPNATLTVYENQNHVWPLSSISSEASLQLLEEMDVLFNPNI